jgi:hypothetical protein
LVRTRPALLPLPVPSCLSSIVSTEEFRNFYSSASASIIVFPKITAEVRE